MLGIKKQGELGRGTDEDLDKDRYNGDKKGG